MKELAFQTSNVLILWQCPTTLDIQLAKFTKNHKVVIIIHPLSTIIAHVWLIAIGGALPFALQVFSDRRKIFVSMKTLPSFIRELGILIDTNLSLSKSPEIPPKSKKF